MQSLAGRTWRLGTHGSREYRSSSSSAHPGPARTHSQHANVLNPVLLPGYDYINRDESTLGNVMADGGYKTAHFGKWHNGRTLGYEPWEMGFQESWLPTSHVHLDNLMR